MDFDGTTSVSCDETTLSYLPKNQRCRICGWQSGLTTFEIDVVSHVKSKHRNEWARIHAWIERTTAAHESPDAR